MSESAGILDQTRAYGRRTTTGRTYDSRATLVVIGNGMVGFKLCERLAALAAHERYRIVIFGEEPRPAYDRVHLTDFFQSPADEVLLAPANWYAESGMELHTGSRVADIDREKRTVRTTRGDSIVYDKLVFATGSRPFVPPVPGADLPNVFVYRTLDDLIAIGDAASTSKTAAVIGGGLLGLEAARALQSVGVQCHVVEYAAQVLCAQLDSVGADMARQSIEALGLNVRVNSRLERIESSNAGLLLSFSGNDQQPLRVDMVVIAAGIRPRDELARDAGLNVAVSGGIAIDDKLQTSDPDIYAIGECARHRGVHYGLVAPGYRMAEVLADNFMGGRRVFAGADQSTRLKVLGLDVAVMGDYLQPGDIIAWKSDTAYRRIVIRNDRLVGASAFGEWPEAGQVQDAVLRSRRLWPWQIARFSREGRLWRSRDASVKAWSAADTVCNCMSVSCGALRKACAAGCTTVEALAAATGASTVCGSCKPLLANLLDVSAAPQKRRGSAALVASISGALVLVMAVMFLPDLTYSTTVQTPTILEGIWRTGVWRQATGFTLAAVSLMGMGMSLRKRLRRFSWGDYGLWRAAHAIVGVAGLAVLLAHTGMRFGSNLNFALMAAFVSANLFGALAGAAVVSTESSSSPTATLARRWLTWAHILLLWPLPVLLGFHILSVYYF